MWNLIGLLLILFIVSKGRRFDGENTWFYFLWYGLGRSWIEGLRTDSLYLFNWELFGQRIRVSQALSIVMVAVAAFMLFYNICIKKRSPESLWVNQVAAEKARAGRCGSGGRRVGGDPYERSAYGGRSGGSVGDGGCGRPRTPETEFAESTETQETTGKGRDAWQ